MPTHTAIIKPVTRRSFPKPGTKLYEAVTHRAKRELDWYFENPNDHAKRADAAATIQAWLAALPPFYRGAIALRYDATRAWPARVKAEFGKYTAIVVRFYGADHPTIGSASTVEQAIAKRIDAILEERGREVAEVRWLKWRAMQFFDKAVVAFTKARGTGKCVAPWTKRRKPRHAVPQPAPQPMPPASPSGTRLSETSLDLRDPSPVASV